MTPAQESAVRTIIAAGGGALAGWAIGKGYITQAQANAILSNQQFLDTATTVLLTLLGMAVPVASGIWGVIVHRKPNLVATVAAMPEVAEVKVTPTQAGRTLAAEVVPAPGALVTVAK